DKRVRVGMQSAVIPEERRSAVRGFLHAIGTGIRVIASVTTKIDLVRIIWIDRNRLVIVALAAAEPATAGELSAPGDATVSRLALCAGVRRSATGGVCGSLTSRGINRDRRSDFVDCQAGP